MSNKKKILFRMRSMEMGGAQKVLITLLKNLDQEKFSISLLLNLKQGVALDEVPSDIKVYSLAKGKESMSTNKFIRLIQLVIRRIQLQFFIWFPSLVESYVKSASYDIDIAFIDSLIPDLLKSNAKKKIGWIHGDITKSDHSIEKKKDIAREISLLDKAIYVSKNTLEATATLDESVRNNGEVIYNPFDVEEITKKSIELVQEPISSLDKDGVMSFVYLGRVYSTKGCFLLIEAHKKLLQEGVKHKIHIVGEGTESDNMRNLIAQYGVQDTFIMYGEKENPYPYVKQSDVFILPSFSEGYPLSLVEALIVGKPVLTTKVGGIAEIVENGKNGLFIEYSQEGVEQGIKTFVNDTELFYAMREKNKQEKDRFSPVPIYKQIEDIFLND